MKTKPKVMASFLFTQIGALMLLFASPAGAAETQSETNRSFENTAVPKHRKPNIVIVFTDDQGWGDLSCNGSEDIPTPHIDRLATEGIRFTDFYVSQPVCSASRASLVTGCYANRLGIAGALGPNAKVGLAPEEHTIAEVVKPLAYHTACFGKWHLGHHPEFLPTQQGFDEYYGIPYSNDMWPGYPPGRKNYPPLQWYTGDGPDTQITHLDDQELITRRLTEKAVDFIHRCGQEPFLLYLPHSMPHVPLAVAPEFRQSTMYGPYGDVIREIDWSVGQLTQALEEEGVLDDTLIMFTSDNGPWLNYGDHAGTTGGLREGKGTTFEGGVRVPFVCRYPRQIPPGQVCSEPAMTIDILPTIVEITGGAAPTRATDGISILPLLRGDNGATSPHEALFFWYGNGRLEAMRKGLWKLHFAHGYRSLQGRRPGNNGIPARYTYNVPLPSSLFNLERDRGETRDVAHQNHEVVLELTKLADQMRAELGDKLTGIEGTANRGPGRIEEPTEEAAPADADHSEK